MGVLGVGVDILRIPRIKALIQRRGAQAFARRILSAQEMDDWSTRALKEDPLFLAVRFCVKEAAYKALYPVCRPTWQELTYSSFGRLHAGSKPALMYKPLSCADNNKVGRIHVSVSHEDEYVTAMVIAEELF